MPKFLPALAVAAACAAIPAAAQPISIGTNPQGSLAYASASAIADVVGDAIGEGFTVVPQGGPTAIIPAMSRGKFTFAFANIVPAAFAMEGGGPFKGRKFDTLRIAAVVYPLRVGVFVREDSGISSVPELAGKRVASEFKTQANVGAFLKAALAMSGISYDDVTPVPVQNGPQAVNEMIDGAIDATLFSVGSGVVAKADAAVGIRFLSVAEGDEAAKILSEMSPGAVIGTVSAGSSAGVDADTNVIQAPFLVLTTESVDEETVYKVVKAIAENKDALAEAQGQFKGLSLEGMADPSLPVPYHPGAIKFYEEAGMWSM